MIKETIYENYYVDETGKVYTDKYCKRNNINALLQELKPRIHKRGYAYVHPYYDIQKRVFVILHRLIWETFNGPIPPELEIHHRDHNKLNNSLENLELVTRSQNMQYYHQYKREKQNVLN